MHIQSVNKMPWPSKEHRRWAACYKWYSSSSFLLYSFSHFFLFWCIFLRCQILRSDLHCTTLLTFFCFFRFSFASNLPIAVEHNHEEDFGRVEAAQQAGCLIYRSINSIDSKMEKFSFDCTMIEYNTKDTT